MPTEIYKIGTITTLDGIEIELSPLKIKYLKQFMAEFQSIKKNMTDEQSLDALSECTRIAMKQYYPELSKSVDLIQENFDLQTIYLVLDYAAGIKINDESKETVTDQALKEKNDLSWEDMDLAKLETEAFLLGIWKNYEELETSISMQELISILEARRELSQDEKRFMAALQGINLDEGREDPQKKWEDMKARVFSRGQAANSNDILSLQGQNAAKAGFGIGMGLEYEVVKG